QAVLVAAPAGIAFTQISAGGSHTCAVASSGDGYCWGYDGQGQLGDDATLADKSSPVKVAPPAGVTFVSVSAGGNHTCGVATSGDGYCWGSDSQGQLGDDALFANKPTPAKVAGAFTWSTISAGANHTCGVT